MNKATFSAIVCLCMVTFVLVIVSALEQTEIQQLQEQVKALKDTQDGVDNHLRFVDSDHAKLGQDIANLRQDLDNLRYRNQPEER